MKVLLMPHYTENLLIKPAFSPAASGEALVVTPESTGFEYLTMRVRKLASGRNFLVRRNHTETDCEVALCYSRAEEKFPARLIKPEEVEVEIRGGANATRQINHILKPEFAAQRLLLVEVYTPGGN